jgi:hypothetical protein
MDRRVGPSVAITTLDYVGLAEFNYNAATYLATKESPFKVAYGMEPLQVADLVKVVYVSIRPTHPPRPIVHPIRLLSIG